ncbi:MAG: hypothetical protein ACT4PL_12445, partial [Phycisphaerales bacterium]
PEIVETIPQHGCIDLLNTVGPVAALAAAALEHDWPPHRLHRFETLDDKTAPALTALLRPGDALLLKGSRRMALERIVRRLRDTAPTPTIPGPSAPTFAQ